MLEMARVMAKYEFDATIVFMAVAGEEQSLLGSTHFAEQAKQKNWNIDAMFTNDIVGNTLGGNGVRDRGTCECSPKACRQTKRRRKRLRAAVLVARTIPLHDNSRGLSKRQAKAFVPQFKVMLVYRRDRYGRGGDHIPFLERGFPAVRFTEVNEEFRHQHQNVRVENGVQFGDLPEFVDFAYVANVARVNAASLAALALAPSRPKGVTILSQRLSNDTELKLGREQGAGSGGLRDRLARHNGGRCGLIQSRSGT